MSFMRRLNGVRPEHGLPGAEALSRAQLAEAAAADLFVLGLARALSAPSGTLGDGPEAAPSGQGTDVPGSQQQQQPPSPQERSHSSSAPPSRRSGRWQTPFGRSRLGPGSPPELQGMQRAPSLGTVASESPPAAEPACTLLHGHQPGDGSHLGQQSALSSSGLSADAPPSSACSAGPGGASGASQHAQVQGRVAAAGQPAAGEQAEPHVRFQEAGSSARARQEPGPHSLDCIFPQTSWAPADGAARGQREAAQRTGGGQAQQAGSGHALTPAASWQEPQGQPSSHAPPEAAALRTASGSLLRDSPIWRPGELGGPGGRLQTISMLPRGQVAPAPAPTRRGSASAQGIRAALP